MQIGAGASSRDDAQLVEATLAGHKAAFNLLWARYESYLSKIACKLSKGQSVARDIVQESCLRAYLGLGALRNVNLLKSWLVGIVINVTREWLRDKESHLASLGTLASVTGGLQFAEPQSPPQSADDPASLFESKEINEMLMDSLMELPAKTRRSALLFYFDGMSLKEIAALLHVTPQALKTRLSRARASLRKKLIAKGVSSL